jgi:hypothetical protein
LAAYSGSRLVGGIARVIAKHPHANIANVFNHKQVDCKMWARDKLFESIGTDCRRVVVLGGWYGVLSAMLLEYSRFDIEFAVSCDLDPVVEPVARTLDYRALNADLLINTSCEHLATRVMLIGSV